MWLATCLQALACLSILQSASAFNFSTSETPSECDDYTVEWEGGQEPFNIVVVPSFGTPRNHSVPSSSFQNGKGSFTTVLDFPASEKFIVFIEDVTGILGTTQILTLESSQGGSCNTTDPGVNFEFQLNSALTQCQPYEFTGYVQTGGVKPITIYAIVPGGESAILTTGNQNSYTWIANVYNETTLMFVAVDAQGRTGGASDFRTVATSNDRSCISENSISTTAVPETTGESTPTSQPESDDDDDNSTPKAAIFASVFGSLIFLAVAITLGLFYLRKRRNQRNAAGWISGSGKTGFRRQSGRVRSEIDIPSGYHTSYPSGDGPHTAQYPATPFSNYEDHDPHAPYSARSQVVSEYDENVPPIDPFITPTPTGQRRESMSTAQRKAASAGLSAYKPSRYVLHTDIDDVEPVPDASGVVELPPQYTERRAPPPPPTITTPGPSSPTWSNSPDAPRAI